jgi:hypothetical protein
MNLYDNLFGKDRDWIEETLRDYDVPNGVIMQIGANFCVMQQQLDKKSNRRDIFAEIAADADREEASRAQLVKVSDSYKEESIMREIDGYFEGMIRADEEDNRPHIFGGKLLTSLKRQIPTNNTTPDFIESLWSEGLEVTYNLLPREQRHKAWVPGRTASYIRKGVYLLHYINGVQQRSFLIHDFLKYMKYADRRQLIKKLLKNSQRRYDRARK